MIVNITKISQKMKKINWFSIENNHDFDTYKYQSRSID